MRRRTFVQLSLSAALLGASAKAGAQLSAADVTGVDLDIQTIAANRSSFAIGRLTERIIATQQAVVDRFRGLGLIPKPITVREAVWSGALA